MSGPRFLDESSRFVDRFGLLSAVTMLTVALLMLVDITVTEQSGAGRWIQVGTFVLAALTLSLALRAAGLAQRWQRAADGVVTVVVILMIAGALLETFVATESVRLYPAPILVVVLAVIAPLAVIMRLARHRHVTRATILGAISGYLLLAILFFYLFLLVAEFTGDTFFGTSQPTQAYMYFSLASITTTGYGDLTAQTDVARLLATTEAVTGQIYLVVFVAMVVGLFIAGRRMIGRAATEDCEGAGSDTRQ